MNAYEIPNLRFSLPAGGAVPRRRFVAVNSSGEGVLATAAGATIGVSMNEAADEEVLEVADGLVMVEAEEAITAGTYVEVGTDGKAAAADAGVKVAYAITGATAPGHLVTVKIG